MQLFVLIKMRLLNALKLVPVMLMLCCISYSGLGHSQENGKQDNTTQTNEASPKGKEAKKVGEQGKAAVAAENTSGTEYKKAKKQE
ncbi:hypothetical protein [Candidatus Thiosymbion oneisti]|uniref:hypothetical protein n=1 Tax=Candidatus Thiosymbion oneisti TaxID=589554 RepID=UPI000B7C7E3E|nr:hypothetical protein [Candidatus Thiosymbion oneisti]